MPKMMNAVRSAIIMGYKVGKGFLTVVYKIADAFIDCEHFLSHENCEKIKTTVSKIGAKVTEIATAIKDAIKKGITQAERIYTNTLNYFKNKFGRSKRSILDKFDFEEKLKKYKEMLKKHIATADKYLKEALKVVMEKFKIADQAIKQAVEKAIAEGKIKYEQIKQYIKELIAKKENGQSISKRDTYVLGLKDLLKKALAKATGVTKYILKKLIELPMEKLQSMKRMVQDIVDKVLGTETKRDAEDETNDMNVDNMLLGKVNELSDELEDQIDDMVADIAEETHDVIHEVLKGEKNMQKRQIDINLKDLNLAEYVTEVLKQKVGDLYKKVMGKSSELMKEIKEALANAGNNLLNVSKVILDKVNKMIEKIKAGKEF